MASNPRAWRNSIEIQPGESLASVAIRLAPKGRLSVDQLLEYGLQVESLPALIGDLKAIERLAALGSFDLADLDMRGWTVEKGGVSWRGRELPETWVTPYKRRLAPGRLVSDDGEPFHRRSWQVNAFGCDLETGECLIDICPKCRIELSWVDVQSVVHCQGCGYDLRKISPTFAEDSALKIARRFNAFFCGDFDLPPPFDTMSFPSVCHGMEWFAYFRSILNGPILSPTAQNALFGFEALEYWPASFDFLVWRFFQSKLGTNPTTWPEADQTPALGLLQVIGKAQTRELHEALTTALVKLLGTTRAAARPFFENANQSHWIREAMRGRSPYRAGWIEHETQRGRRRRRS